MSPIRRKRSPGVERWLSAEIADQVRRRRRIVTEQAALAPRREKWVTAFLQRIQVRGFNVDADHRRVVSAEEIPVRPRRKYRVIF